MRTEKNVSVSKNPSVSLSLYIGAFAGLAGYVGLCGTYAAVLAVDTVTATSIQ
jgi:hypothetical protein